MLRSLLLTQRPYAVIAMSFLLLACRSNAIPTATPTASNTSTPATPISTITAFATPSINQSNTSKPTESPSKTVTPTQSPAPTATNVPPLKPAPDAGTIIVENNNAGIEVELAVGAGTQTVKELGAAWIRYNGLIWGEVEPNQGDRKWESQTNLETRLKEASAAGLKTILIIRGVPKWARQVESASCGPIKTDALAYYALFLRDTVKRYSSSPFNLKYWELWNEPDVATEAVANIPDSPFGCWGNPKDDYFGGREYAEHLKVAYPLIKSADPKAQVLVGGLLLDCDPRMPKPDKDCKPAKYFEGILKNDGGKFFDGVSFHAYDFFYGKTGHYGNANWFSAWNVTGPVLVAKTRFIKELLAQYGVKGKYLINTETGLLCYQCQTVPVEFEITKANYVPQTYAMASAEGLSANVWYSLSGWQDSGLVNKNGPTLAHKAYLVWNAQTKNAQFVREVISNNGIKAYEYKRGEKRLWVVWSLDGSSKPIKLPSAATSIVDVYGNAKPNSITQIDITPLYIELEK